MKACCNPLYQNTFDLEKAQEELKNYLQKGVKKSSRPLIQMARQLPLQGKTLLDIGGGIGTIGFELFMEGIDQATLVDISEAYIATFDQEAHRRSLEKKITSHNGDFLVVRDQVEPADLVTLDKVICCYENYADLVRYSIGKARKWYVYSIPRDVWWVKIGQRVDDWIRKMKGKPFDTYVHPTKTIEQIITTAGFIKIDQRYQREWVIVAFEKGRDDAY